MNSIRLVTILAAALVATACTEENPAAKEPATGEQQQAQQAEKPAAQQQPAAAQQPQQIEAPPDVAAVPADAEKTPSGLASKVLQKGTGDKKPGPEDVVTVHYTGWTTDGKMFDSSVTRGRPATFPLNAVIPGWTQALQEMVVGEKARIWIPEEHAYKGRPGAPQGMLVFDVELLNIVDAAPRPPAPTPAPTAQPPQPTK